MNERFCFTSGISLLEFLFCLIVLFVALILAEPLFVHDGCVTNARRVVCLSNLRGLGQEMQIYAEENQGQYPCLNTLPATYSLILDKKNDRMIKAFICPERTKNHFLPPESAQGKLLGSADKKNLISYLIVKSCDSQNPSLFRAPKRSDYEQNVLLIEDFRADQDSVYSKNDNHGCKGGNLYRINGKSQWSSGMELPFNHFADTGKGEVRITAANTLNNMGGLFDVASLSFVQEQKISFKMVSFIPVLILLFAGLVMLLYRFLSGIKPVMQ